MAVHLNVLLILTGLTGIHSLTVSKMTAKVGNSISFPCRYSAQYRGHVKYLCRGESWRSCSTEVQTDTQGSSRKFSISDDKIQAIFTVTIKDLKIEDTDYYWCIVKIDLGGDVGARVSLWVTAGTPRLSVDRQTFTGFRGEPLTINCYCNPGVMKWCKLDSTCVSTIPGIILGTRVNIRWRVPSVFLVTMSELRTDSGGWYMCVSGDVQLPVHVTVTERPTTTTLATTRRLTTSSPTPTRVVKTEQGSSSSDPNSLIISLTLLISIVMVALFVWFMIRKQKQTKEKSSDTTMVEEDVMYGNVQHKKKASCQTEEEVTYCNLGYSKTSGQRSFPESDVDVMYSSVVPIKKHTVNRVEAEMDVTYSTLAQHH